MLISVSDWKAHRLSFGSLPRLSVWVSQPGVCTAEAVSDPLLSLHPLGSETPLR